MIDKLKLGNTEELNKEINSKMQRMLEETLARNAQLQKVNKKSFFNLKKVFEGNIFLHNIGFRLFFQFIRFY